ncbi:MAG TPA: hypothetical protein VIJ13_06680, partial [Actinomycetota bacterium]
PARHARRRPPGGTLGGGGSEAGAGAGRSAPAVAGHGQGPKVARIAAHSGDLLGLAFYARS